MNKFAYLFVFLVLILAGCVQSKVVRRETRMGTSHSGEFPKVSGAKLELSLAGSPELISGRDKHVTFILRNLSDNPVSIPEWYTHEPDNIEVSCQIWFPNRQYPEKDRWVTYPVILKQPVMHYPLRIGAKMFVTVDVPLDFLSHLRVQPGTERRYFIKGRLNLASVSAESKTSAITVKAPTPAKRSSRK